MKDSNKDENISFLLDDIYEEKSEIELDFSTFLNDCNIDTDIVTNYNELMIPKIIDYQINYTVKELMIICDYYNISKEVKINKYNKDDLIAFLVNFEIDPINEDIVFKRQNMWFYMNELKNDKFMKKFVLW